MDFKQVVEHYKFKLPKRQEGENFFDYKYRQKLERLILDYNFRKGHKLDD